MPRKGKKASDEKIAPFCPRHGEMAGDQKETRPLRLRGKRGIRGKKKERLHNKEEGER